MTEAALTRFRDQQFGGSLYQSMSEEIEKADLLIDSFVQFLSVSAPLKKTSTVHRLIDEVVKKHQIQLDRKGVKLSEKFESDLPETIIPDALLSYILDSILQYGISAVPSGGEMEFSTKSFRLGKGVTVRKEVLRGGNQYIQIGLLFEKVQEQEERFSQTSIVREDPLDIMLLRLVQELVRRNHGIMKWKNYEKQARMSISLWLPSERREIIYHQPRRFIR